MMNLGAGLIAAAAVVLVRSEPLFHHFRVGEGLVPSRNYPS